MKDEVPLSGIECWAECGAKSRLKNVYVTSLEGTSRAAMYGITVPSKLLKVDDHPLEGIDIARFRKLLRAGQHRLTFGVGKLRDAAKAKVYADTWQDLNRDLRLAVDEPGRILDSKDDGDGGFYHICLPKVADARRLFVLGTEFLIDHINMSPGSPGSKRANGEATVEDWRKVIGAWADEQEVRGRIKNMNAKECGNFILLCVHYSPNLATDGGPAYELVGACQFFPEACDDHTRSLYISKLKVRKKYQRQGLAQMMYHNAVIYVRDKLATTREELFGKLCKSGLNVLGDNTAAIELYKELGYKITKETKSRVLDDATMIRMEMDLPWAAQPIVPAALN